MTYVSSNFGLIGLFHGSIGVTLGPVDRAMQGVPK